VILARDEIIRTVGLEKRFGRRVALAGLDLSVSRGEFLTLFGPNGAGKTTLVRCLATLAHPTSGDAWIAGERLRSATPDIRRRIGVVSHSSFLYGALTARENLVFYGRMFGVADVEGRVAEVARAVGLHDRLDEPVRTFSRGSCSAAR
jgi:heme exporter protein A